MSEVPNVTFRRFTPCGRFLVATAHDARNLVVFRVESGGRRRLSNFSSTSTSPDTFFESYAFRPPVPSSVLIHPSLSPSPSANSLLAGPSYFNNPFQQTTATPSLFHQPSLPPDVNANTNANPPLLIRIPVGTAARPPHSHVQPRPSAAIQPDPQHTYSCTFQRFFTQLYSTLIAIGHDYLVREFCLVSKSGRYLILASFDLKDPNENDDENDDGNDDGNEHPEDFDDSTINDSTNNGEGDSQPRASRQYRHHRDQHPDTEQRTRENVDPSRWSRRRRRLQRMRRRRRIPALDSTPVYRTFTLHLVDVENGQVQDRFCLKDDFIHVDGHAGVDLRGDTMGLLSIRFQSIHLLTIQESQGRFIHRCSIGLHCRPDDGMTIATAREAEHSWRHNQYQQRQQEQRSGSEAGNNHIVSESEYDDDDSEDDDDDVHYADAHILETGLGGGRLRKGFFTGLMQRLLAYMYRRLQREGKIRLFYRLIGQYSMLLMQRVQLLDDDHLLIRLGSFDSDGKPSDPTLNTCFFVVYCISSTSILNIFDNFSTHLLSLLQSYSDIFIGDPAVAATLLPTSFQIHPRQPTQTLTSSSSSSGMTSQVRMRIKGLLSALPFHAQARNVSPYLDRSLFSYPPDLLPALDGTRAMTVREKFFKFTSVQSGCVRFKLAQGLPSIYAASHGQQHQPQPQGRTKMLFLFHPSLPLVLSMEHGTSFGARLNIHVYGHDER